MAYSTNMHVLIDYFCPSVQEKEIHIAFNVKQMIKLQR